MTSSSTSVCVGDSARSSRSRPFGWDGAADGELLRKAAAEYDALVTMDQGIPHQQNFRNLELGIVIVRAVSNRLVDTAPLVPAICEALRSIEPGHVVYVPAQ